MAEIKDFRNSAEKPKNDLDQTILLYVEGYNKYRHLESNEAYMVVEEPGTEKAYIFQSWTLPGYDFVGKTLSVQKAYKTFKGAQNHLLRVLKIFPLK